MLYDIFRFVIDTVGDILGSALLLRAYMQWVRLSPRNPLSGFVFTITNWLVLPLRRVLPGVGGIDWASVVGALLVALVVNLLLVLPFGTPAIGGLIVASLFACLKWATYLVFGLVLVHVILSWVNPHAPMAPAVDMLVAPMLAPIRRVLPTFGGIDFSPLVLILIVQVAQMVIARVMAMTLGLF
ncbi:YggT family protein [Derxia gummosa]|uniref:YggT family protein n=1 Tax=Derxia gummosa DSM 723 TaxID=1121388 RepID=A0A8B6X2U1_9BURK|nr:YggT family protein [Derxia gummosa]